jgi:hypothetical protein
MINPFMSQHIIFQKCTYGITDVSENELHESGYRFFHKLRANIKVEMLMGPKIL